MGPCKIIKQKTKKIAGNGETSEQYIIQQQQ